MNINVLPLCRLVCLAGALFSTSAFAQTNSNDNNYNRNYYGNSHKSFSTSAQSNYVHENRNIVDRINHDSETGNFVDKWELGSNQAQKILDNFTIISDHKDGLGYVCHAYINGIHYFWETNAYVFSPEGQVLSQEDDEILMASVEGKFEYTVQPNSAGCDRLVALYANAANPGSLAAASASAGALGSSGLTVNSLLIGAAGLAVPLVIGAAINNGSSTPPPASPIQ